MSMDFESTSRERLRRLALACRTLEKKEKAERLEAGLINFVREAWPSIDPAEYQPCWAIDALCEHLQAVSEGQIRNLLVNIPPRCGKTTIASVCYPAWTWAQAEVSFLSEWSDDWTHLCIPMQYEARRHCVTVLGWEDPRGLDKDGKSLAMDGRVPRDTATQLELEECEGALMWPERFGAQEVARIKAELGPYMASGRLQQMPVPDQGGIFQRDWWQPYDSQDGKFPVLSYIVASLDGAFTEKEENDPLALTVWGVFQNEEGKSRIMLVHAWRKHLPFSGERMDKGANETLGAYKQRTRSRWGLMEWVNDTCERFKVNLLLIENK